MFGNNILLLWILRQHRGDPKWMCAGRPRVARGSSATKNANNNNIEQQQKPCINNKSIEHIKISGSLDVTLCARRARLGPCPWLCPQLPSGVVVFAPASQLPSVVVASTRGAHKGMPQKGAQKGSPKRGCRKGDA